MTIDGWMANFSPNTLVTLKQNPAGLKDVAAENHRQL
jgi:hypothetical protein